MDFNIQLDEQAVNKVLDILSERPFREVAQLIAAIANQMQAQARLEQAAKAAAAQSKE